MHIISMLIHLSKIRIKTIKLILEEIKVQWGSE